MPNIGFPELILILVIALVVFGPKRLPEVSRTIGKSLREFRKASTDWREQLERGLSEDDDPDDPVGEEAPAGTAAVPYDPSHTEGPSANGGRSAEPEAPADPGQRESPGPGPGP